MTINHCGRDTTLNLGSMLCRKRNQADGQKEKRSVATQANGLSRVLQKGNTPSPKRVLFLSGWTVNRNMRGKSSLQSIQMKKTTDGHRRNGRVTFCKDST